MDVKFKCGKGACEHWKRDNRQRVWANVNCSKRGSPLRYYQSVTRATICASAANLRINGNE
jgi:hypothetical protein